MEKKYNLPEENNEPEIGFGERNVEEPALNYGKETEMIFSPPLTEEELTEAFTTEQVQDHLHKLIDKLFD